MLQLWQAASSSKAGRAKSQASSQKERRQRRLKKTLYTLNVNNYAPDICSLTYPLLRRYAEKIGAEFYIISERQSPDCNVTIEKLQIHSLAKERGDDWAIYVDSDCLIHPDTMDFTEILPMDTVMNNGKDYASCRFVYDDYFRRDGRHIASCGWLSVASRWCLDLWKPLDDLSYAEAVSRIKPTAVESRTGITADHLIDDFIVSRNIAKYGLKHTTFREVLAKAGMVDSSFLWHEYTIPVKTKLAFMKKVLTVWTGQEVR